MPLVSELKENDLVVYNGKYKGTILVIVPMVDDGKQKMETALWGWTETGSMIFLNDGDSKNIVSVSHLSQSEANKEEEERTNGQTDATHTKQNHILDAIAMSLLNSIPYCE